MGSFLCVGIGGKRQSKIVPFMSTCDVQVSCHLTSSFTFIEHHGVQPTGCMDNEPEPSRGVRIKAFLGRPTNSGSTLPRAVHLYGSVIGCHQCISVIH